MNLHYEKPKKPKKPKAEGEKRKSKKKKIDDDQLFASRTPSPARSNSSGEESEAESSANESENEENSDSNQSAKTPVFEKPVFVGIEERLHLEEVEFLAKGPDFEYKSQSIEMEVDNTIAVLPDSAEGSQSLSWRQFDSVGEEEDSNLEVPKVKRKQVNFGFLNMFKNTEWPKNSLDPPVFQFFTLRE
jgi:hypothetical protein